MKTLNILYDRDCGLCRKIRLWLSQQPAYVRLNFIPLQDEFLEQRFPGVGALRPSEEIVVIADTGEAWRGVNAWIMALWALKEYRAWSLRMAHPALKPLARRICHGIAGNRLRISKWLFGNTPEEAAKIAERAG